MPPELKRKKFSVSQKQLRPQLVFGMIVILATLLFGFAMWQFVWNRLEKLSENEYSLSIQQERIENLKEKIAGAKDFLASMENIKGEDLRRLEMLLPANPDLPSLLVELNLIAEQAGWTISLVSFSSEQKEQTSLTSTLSQKTQILDVRKARTFTIKLNVSGSTEYKQFKELLSLFENSLRLINTQQFSYAVDQNSFTFVLEGYWYPTELSDEDVQELLTLLLSSDLASNKFFADKRFLTLKRLSQDQYAYYPSPIYVKDDVPKAPSGLVAYDMGWGQTILLSWSTPSQDTQRVHLFRATQPDSDGEEIASLPANVLYYTDKDVENGRPYYYFLKGSNEQGTMSAPSGIVSASARDRQAPGPVRNVSFDNSKEGSVKLYWSNPKDSDFSYVNVYRSLGGNDVPIKVGAMITAESFEDTVTAGAGNYYYFLSSVDTSGNESEIFSVQELISSQNPFK